MNFEKIDELNSDEINELYNDILEFGDNIYISNCQCVDGSNQAIYSDISEETCKRWCRNLGRGYGCNCWDPYYCCHSHCFIRCRN